jgi:hypothetical protein
MGKIHESAVLVPASAAARMRRKYFFFSRAETKENSYLNGWCEAGISSLQYQTENRTRVKVFMKYSGNTHHLLFGLLIGIFIAAFCPAAHAQKSGDLMTIKVYFPREDPNADNELVAVERAVKKTPRAADAAIKELLKGVKPEDRKKGLTSAYAVEDIVTGRGECLRARMKPLAAYFIGVAVRRGVATVNFRPEAECYLQSAAFQMSRVMNPIDATLKQFKSIREVRYALNGKVIAEWDA